MSSYRFRKSNYRILDNAEFNKAIEAGYRIIDIHEVHHFSNTSTELFKQYIRKFLKIKLETSPFNCSEKDYRQKAKLQEIELGELKPNPGLRFISKICHYGATLAKV